MSGFLAGNFQFCSNSAMAQMLKKKKNRLEISRLNGEHTNVLTEFICHLMNRDLSRQLFISYDSMLICFM